jgi:hypothetical protein
VLSRYDVLRSALALLAALVSAMGAVAATTRSSVPTGETAVALLGAETALAAVFALWPSGRLWSSRRQALAGVTALVALVAMIPGPFISAIVVPGCVCPLAPPPFEALGIGAQYWVIAGLLGFPLLMFFAALIPRRPSQVAS